MKISPNTLLASLIALASVGGAVLHGKKISKQLKSSPAQEQQIAELQRQVGVLQAENETLKKLQLSTEVTLPDSHYTFVEDNLGLTFPAHIKARRVDEDTLMEAVSYRYTERFGIEGMEMREYALARVGILPADQVLLTQLAMAETAGAVCIYDSSANELLLSASYDEENLFHATSVIKQLSIALLETVFPLTKQQAVNLTDDFYFARNGFIRGRSTSIAQRYRNITAFKGEHSKKIPVDPAAQKLFNSLPSLVQGLTTFPAIHGKTYIEEIIFNNNSVFPEIYKNMPRSTATIFAKTMPAEEEFTPQPAIADDEHLNTQLGQVFAMLYLQQSEDSPADLHQKLTSDRLTISQDLEDPLNRNQFISKWSTYWQEPEDAQTFYQLATQLSKLSDHKPTVTISENQVIIQFIDIHNS